MKKRDAGRETREDEVFRAAVGDVSPLRPQNRVEPFREPPSPLARMRREDERAVLEELLHAGGDDEGEIEEDSAYLRPGLPRDILRKLRRTHWVIQDQIDLHGLSGDEAALETAAFLSACVRRGLRCVRIVHGKGLRSARREPVLKKRVRRMLTRRDEVLAFVEPRAIHGGGGAVVVLLEG